MSKQHVRSIRLSDDDVAKLEAIRKQDERISAIHRLNPRKEGQILAAAISAGIHDLYHRISDTEVES